MAEIGKILGRKRALQIKKAQIRPDRRSDKKALPENAVLPKREVIPPDHRSHLGSHTQSDIPLNAASKNSTNPCFMACV